MTNSRAKGAAAERELAERLRSMGYLSARRSQQYCGLAEGDGDLVVTELPTLHIESKRVERINIDKAMEQAVRDATKAGTVPVVMHRRSKYEWLVTIRLADMQAFAHAIHTSAKTRAFAEYPG